LKWILREKLAQKIFFSEMKMKFFSPIYLYISQGVTKLVKEDCESYFQNISRTRQAIYVVYNEMIRSVLLTTVTVEKK
jgi:anaerobic ribonucleoside-triphosphate reductase